jgi:hypothetical protein
MSDLSEYFSQQDRINELEADLIEAKRIITNERVYKNRYKRMYEDLKGKKLLIKTRKSKAIALIKKLKDTDKPGLLIKAIAKQCSLSESRINDYWYST